MKAPMPVLTFDRRKNMPFLAGLIAGATFFAAALCHLLIKIDRVMIDGEWQLMPSIGMLGHIL
ncbi:MAG: hypothetical protein ACR2RA_24415 [Geminicoccaceae bacterium]